MARLWRRRRRASYGRPSHALVGGPGWSLLLLCSVLLGWSWSPEARAGGPEIDVPRAEDGPGIKVGERSTFHPGFALVTGVDSNVFSTARQEPRPASGEVGPRLASFVMPTGWLGLGNRQFRDGLLMSPPERSGRTADYYIGLVGGARIYMARNPNVRAQNRPTFGLQTRVALLPGRKLSVNVDGDVFHYSQPATYEAGGFNFNRIDGRMGLAFIGRPGGGRLSLMFAPRLGGLYFTGTREEVEGGCDLENGQNCFVAKGNRVVPGFTVETKWRIRPKSALVINYGFDWTYYTYCCNEAEWGRNEDNFANRITAGFRGQVMKKVVLDVIGGYGMGFYRKDPTNPRGVDDFKGPIFELGATYYPNPRSLFYVSAFRTFQDSLLGNYYTDIGARLQARHEFKWRMITTAGAWVAGRRYVGLAIPGSEDMSIDQYQPQSVQETFRRRDVVFNLNLKVEQPLKKIWAVALQYDMAVDDTTFAIDYANGVQDIGGFTRHVVMLLGAVRL
ncbi:hypothetical protein [Paraliomyxa miuraensis]|uniref:hypothetical protein n=1 Tax=Paraliomyxa miuraensis TaxID=376150 RepID=UPI002251DF86|nr:hypothetical protein [Paraliomyxa miuraensis]MCX4239530.1 hypothetical protein [Paraliomyxa miuraensis]